MKITLNLGIWFLFSSIKRTIHSMNGKIKGQLEGEHAPQTMKGQLEGACSTNNFVVISNRYNEKS